MSERVLRKRPPRLYLEIPSSSSSSSFISSTTSNVELKTDQVATTPPPPPPPPQQKCPNEIHKQISKRRRTRAELREIGEAKSALKSISENVCITKSRHVGGVKKHRPLESRCLRVSNHNVAVAPQDDEREERARFLEAIDKLNSVFEPLREDLNFRIVDEEQEPIVDEKEPVFAEADHYRPLLLPKSRDNLFTVQIDGKTKPIWFLLDLSDHLYGRDKLWAHEVIDVINHHGGRFATTLADFADEEIMDARNTIVIADEPSESVLFGYGIAIGASKVHPIYVFDCHFSGQVIEQLDEYLIPNEIDLFGNPTPDSENIAKVCHFPFFSPKTPRN